MAALLRFNFSRRGFGELLESIASKQEFLLRPLAGVELSKNVEAVMRRGIADQFEAGGIPKWEPSKAFGTRQPSRPTLGGAGGRVARAWEGAPVEKGPREIRIRVSDKVALAHHRGATIRPKQSARRMQLALGLGFGVWLSPERLEAGLVLPARPVRFTDDMGLGVKLAIFGGFQAA